MTVAPALRDAALRWIADDVDASDRTELQALLVAAMVGGGTEELAARLAGPLRFGTAGLRGPLRAGPNGMNRAVVVRTTAGLAAWLTAQGRTGTVVVGYDARHRSDVFAGDAAGAFAAAGFDTLMLSRALPTPVLAFAVRRLGAVAGVQITASHNPAGDNGYKVYLDEGAQLVPPVDAEIEAAVAAAPAAVTVPTSRGWRTGGPELLEGYLDRVASLPRGTARELRVAATPLHGVGGAVLVEALRRAGFGDVHLVPSQASPDPDFPTVAFPNPEEPGAADALLALAAEVGADLAVALDPDADRCALGVRDGGEWRMLTGDETGVLLGSHVLATLDRAAHPDPLVATTLVSSTMLRAVAAAHGARCAVTRTGFKWLLRAGDGLVYAYEEALGVCVDPGAVRDKDGLSAAVLACDLAATARAHGRTVPDLLDDLALAHGVHLTAHVTVRVANPVAALAALRATTPSSLAGIAVTAQDVADALALAGEGVRVMVRPSGTEPKLKAYVEVVEPVMDDLAAARGAAVARLAAVQSAVHTLL
ncbi:MAG: phospho-sugar mutase [Pseudonocardiaceae bacterium]